MTRALWTRALAICVLGVLVASLAVAGADAHIGSSHSPYTTSGPDLVSVEIDGNRTDFCFDEAVTGPDPFVADRFRLRGYDSAIELVGDNVSTEARDNCVSVTFNAALPDRELTIGTVAAGAVEDITDAGNVGGAAALTGSVAKGGDAKTSAPNLVDFDEDDAADEITYMFDQNVDCPAGGPPPLSFIGSFGFYRQPGQGGINGREDGDTLVDCDDDEVTIGFIGAGVDNVEFVFVDSGGNNVCAEASDAKAGPCTEYESEGSGSTDSPDLVDAERTGDDQVTFTFDEDVTIATEDAFHVITEDGTQFFGVSGGCDADNEEIECEFDGIEEAADLELVQASVDTGAADDAGDPTLGNTLGHTQLSGGSFGPGLTDAPDLESCNITDQRDGFVTFLFDETVDEGSITVAQFGLFKADGILWDAEDTQNTVGNSVVAQFDAGAMTDPVGCHVAFDAVDDFLGNEAPESAVGLPGAGPSPDPGEPPECAADPSAVCGSSGNDTLQGTPGNDVIYGGSGDDVIDGQGGDDKIFGGEGNDTLNGNEGKDVLVGGSGDDTIIGGSGADSLTGGAGHDKIIGDDRATPSTSSGKGFEAAQAAAGPDTIDGGGGNDSIQGGGGGDRVEGGGGSDKVAGQDGADKVHAGGNEDTVTGGAGADKMWGEKGDDKLKGEAGDDVLIGGEGVNNFNGGPGRDKCVLSNRKDKTESCEKKARSFARSFFPLIFPL